jgi:two-component system, OmpR family, response regulator MprA
MENYDVELFEDGVSALKSIQLRAPDAIVLDLQLPDIDGLEICRRIRRAGDTTPILMLTARDAVNDRVAGLDVGADDYLVKPFDLAELLARLRALLRRHNVATATARCCASRTSRSTPRPARCTAARAPSN